MADKQYIYRDPARVTLVQKIATSLLVLNLGVLAGLLWRQYRLLSDFQAHVYTSSADAIAAAGANDQYLRIAIALMLLFLVATLISFLVWVYRASANAHALGAKDLSASAGFAVGMYFIPVYNVFMVPVVMSEIRKASLDATNWSQRRSAPIIAIWWTLQVASGISGIFVRFVEGDKSINGLKMLSLVLIVSYVIDMGARISQIVLADGIAKAQRAQHDALGVF